MKFLAAALIFCASGFYVPASNAKSLFGWTVVYDRAISTAQTWERVGDVASNGGDFSGAMNSYSNAHVNYTTALVSATTRTQERTATEGIMRVERRIRELSL